MSCCQGCGCHKCRSPFAMPSRPSIEWALDNPMLRPGECAYESDTGRYKIGNGVDLYIELPYQAESGSAGQAGPSGPSGPAGPRGQVGPPVNLQIGTVTTGTTADATITGTSPNLVLNLVLPSSSGGDGGGGGGDLTGVITFTTQPRNVSTVDGYAVILTAEATCNPTDTVTYKWQFQKTGATTWTDIPGGNEKRLVFTARAANSGNSYRCAASAPTAKTVYSTTAAVIAVADPTTGNKVLTQPMPVWCDIGDTAQFVVEFSKPPADYEWQWSRTPTSALWTTISGAKSAVLSLRAAVEDDGKYYRCVGSFIGAGTVATEPALLSVGASGGPQLYFTTQPTPQRVFPGDFVTLTAEARAADGSIVDYAWEQNPVNNNGDNTWYPVFTGQQYSFVASLDPPSTADNSLYRCVATTITSGPVYSNSVKLDIRDPSTGASWRTATGLAHGKMAYADGTFITQGFNRRSSETNREFARPTNAVDPENYAPSAPAFANGTWLSSLIAQGGSGFSLYVSTNRGAAWTPTAKHPMRFWPPVIGSIEYDPSRSFICTVGSVHVLFIYQETKIPFGNPGWDGKPKTAQVVAFWTGDGGNTWGQCDVPETDKYSFVQVRSVANRPGIGAVAVGAGGVEVGTSLSATDKALFSRDGGLSWEWISLGQSAVWNDIADGNQFVAVGTQGKIVTSFDGQGWNNYSTNLPFSANWTGVTFGNGWFVAVAPGSSLCLRSADGGAWVTAPLPEGADWNDVQYGGGIFVATRPIPTGKENSATVKPYAIAD